MTLQNALDYLIRKFKDAGLEQPQFEARQLVQEAFGLKMAQLLSQPDRDLEPEQCQKVQLWAEERVQGVPLAYLSGRKGFYRYEFAVEPGVLVPRPETELVVETAIRRSEAISHIHNIADLGCGSGCIGLSLVLEISSSTLWAVDASAKACEVTRRNAKALGVESRVRVEHKRVEDFSSPEKFDIVVANPPYIAPGDPRVEPNVSKHEPSEALYAEEGGMAKLRSWAMWAHQHLGDGGLYVCEFGSDQGAEVAAFLAKVGFINIEMDRDLAGHDRVISAIKARGG